LQTVPHDPNCAIEFAIGRKAQPQLNLLSSWQWILSLNKNANRADICPPRRDLLVALFEVNVVDQIDPFIPTTVGRTHGVPRRRKNSQNLSILAIPGGFVQTDEEG